MKRFLAILPILLTCSLSFAYDKQHLSDTLTSFANRHAKVGEVVVKQVKVRDGRIDVYTNPTLASLQLTPLLIDSIKHLIRVETGLKGKIYVFSDKHDLYELVSKVSLSSPAAAQISAAKKAMRQQLDSDNDNDEPPLIRQHARPWDAPGGMDGMHIALYGSHGLYFNQKQERWSWQRARVLTTVEDLYTTSYTMPFLVPMLENAGAVVMQPRERDRQTAEIIVDETEAEGLAEWHVAEMNGWGRRQENELYEGENPFSFGTYAYCKSSSPLIYRPVFENEGDYAVYVSYKTLNGSTNQAQYDVCHSGIKTIFLVNQQMGSGTWIYLGTFHFTTNAADNYVKVFSGHGTVTSDAVRFGGGMGSVARYPSEVMLDNIPSAVENGSYNSQKKQNDKLSDEEKKRQTESLNETARTEGIAQTSGVPRWIEGARYYMQYAGIPDSVYNYTESKNDYTDDYASRGRWANYLAGGSRVFPDGPGLNIPIDLFFAFHSDAGTTLNDSIVGTLVIYNEFDDDKEYSYPAGGSRLIARTYADYVQSQIVSDIQATYAPEWNRRRLLNSSYAEARNPKMPAVLLELLSHQNFADMRYGLDPSFRFVVSRAIYKAMLRFLHERYHTPYIVQPLPVRALSCVLSDDSAQEAVRLSWSPRHDSIEPTAKPEAYVVYQRISGQDWDNGTLVSDTVLTLPINRDVQYDFRVTAVNLGGQSFPSETLTAYKASEEKGRVLIVNNFTRVAAPQSFFSKDTALAGFIPEHYAVGYLNDINYIGDQYEFRREQPWESDDQCGFGASYNDYSCISPRGNTFDYTVMHGKVLAPLGFSFSSTSVEALKDEMLHDITLLDIIAGKQKRTVIGLQPDTNALDSSRLTIANIGKQTVKYELFPQNLRRVLETVDIPVLLSGSYLGSEMKTKEEKKWTAQVLHYSFRAERATRSGSIKHLRSWNLPSDSLQRSSLQITPSETTICAEAPDGIAPEGKQAKVALRYEDTGISAGVLFDNGSLRKLVFPFPIESLNDFGAFYSKAILWLTYQPSANSKSN